MSDNANIPDWLKDIPEDRGNQSDVDGQDSPLKDLDEVQEPGLSADKLTSDESAIPVSETPDTQLPSYTKSRTPYVRPRTPHITQEAINDIDPENGASRGSYQHDSNVAIGHAFSGGSAQYRRAHRSSAGMKNNRYGQYLEIPKGRRSIFQSKAHAQRRKSILTLIVVALLLVLVFLFVWHILRG